MGKRTLCAGIIIGAVVGGLVSLTNPEARTYAKTKIAKVKACTKGCINNPSETIHQLRKSVEQFNESFSDNAAGAINALKQVEQTINKLKKRDHTSQSIEE